MGDLMPYDTWMELTNAGRLHKRSDNLKKVDLALKEYHQAKGNAKLRNQWAEAVALWLTYWQDEKEDWSKSVRNKRGAVTTLDEQLKMLAGLSTTLKKRELEALEIVKKAHAETMHALFKNAKVKFGGPGKLDKLGLGLAVNGVTSSCTKLDSAGVKQKQVVKVSHFRQGLNTKANTILVKICGGEQQAKAFKEFAGKPLEQAVAKIFHSSVKAVTPFVGVGVSGASAIASYGLATYNYYEKANSKRSSLVLKDGSPKEASAALGRIFQREIHSNLRSAAISTASVAGKLTGMLVDLGTASGPALGLAESLANFFHLVYLIHRDYREATKANAYIKEKHTKSQPIEKDLFTEAPILGAYYLQHANTSDLLSFLAVSFGSKGWQTDAEGIIKKYIHPLQKQARSVIDSSRLKVTGVANKEIQKKTKKEKKAEVKVPDVKIRGLGSGNMYS